MNFNELLAQKGIDPGEVFVLRHRPHEAGLRRVLPWLASERPEVFNAYQQTQGDKLEKAMKEGGYVASFIARGPGKALFVGLYAIGKAKRLTSEQLDRLPANVELFSFGVEPYCQRTGKTPLWFDLRVSSAVCWV